MTPVVDLDPRRVARAAEALAEGRVRIQPGPEPGTVVVDSFRGDASYLVDIERGTCTCPDAAYRGAALCKHRAAVLLDEGVR